MNTRRTPTVFRPWAKLAAPVVQLHITGTLPATSAASQQSTAAPEAGSMMPTRSSPGVSDLMKEARARVLRSTSRPDRAVPPSASMSLAGSRRICRKAVSTRLRPAGTETGASPEGNHARGGSASSAPPASPAAARMQSPAVCRSSRRSTGCPESSSRSMPIVMSERLSMPRSPASAVSSSMWSTPLSALRMSSTALRIAGSTARLSLARLSPAWLSPRGVAPAGRSGRGRGPVPPRKCPGTASACGGSSSL